MLLLSASLGAQHRFDRFAHDLEAIKTELQIPGMAAAVVDSDRTVWRNDSGFADVVAHRPVTAATSFPIASVTKTMAAVLVMQLVEQGRLSLDDPIVKYVPGTKLAPQITIHQVLSHTADGTPGEEFLYNGGVFNSLTTVVEKLCGKPFAEALANAIFTPLRMTHTTPGLSARPAIAKPYALDNGVTKPSKYPSNGVSAATGVSSTTTDLAKYAIALDGTALLSANSKAAISIPLRSTHGAILPYGLGWFSQTYLDEPIVWHYGQEEAFASLFLRVPNRKLTLIVLANSNTMSDASRLLDGNVARSLVALAFLRDLVFVGSQSTDFEKDEMVDRALVQLFLGKKNESAALARAVVAKFPDLKSSTDLPLLGLLARLNMPEAESVAKAIFRDHPNSPPALFYYGLYLESAGRPKEAIVQFQSILNHQPAWHHWYVSIARQELVKLQ
jgi:CubicO group peptidase (beta-lactamase class C family)